VAYADGDPKQSSALATPLKLGPIETTLSEPSFHREYVLSGKLGAGAFAQVYGVSKVNARADSIPLVVKIMDLRVDRSTKPQSPAEETSAPRKRSALAETAILKQVENLEHCIQMTDCFVEGCFSYIIMGRCDRTLLQAFEGMPALTEDSVKPIFQDMLKGLSAVHAVGVVHRDVKPDNFLCVGQSNFVQLCDFGLASALPASGHDRLSGVYGTPPFMSPEMLGANGYDAKSDVWSLGVIIYVMLLGHFPYKPVEPSGKAMKAAIKAGTPEPTFKLKVGLDSSGCTRASKRATSLLLELLVRDPHRRPSAASALKKPWFVEQAPADEERNLMSLRPVLYAARRAGAFDPPRKEKEVDKTGVDSLMADLQAKHHRNCMSPTKSPKTLPSSASTETGSMCNSDRSGQSSVDFHAPGVVG